MVRFDSTHFGEVVVDRATHKDVLVVDGEVIDRDNDLAEKEVGSSHAIGETELEQVLSGGPEFVVVGDGQSSCLRVQESVKKKIQEKGVQLVVLPTPKAIQEFNRLVAAGKKVNALVHVTC